MGRPNKGGGNNGFKKPENGENDGTQYDVRPGDGEQNETGTPDENQNPDEDSDESTDETGND